MVSRLNQKTEDYQFNDDADYNSNFDESASGIESKNYEE